MENPNKYPIEHLPYSLQKAILDVVSETKAPLELVAASMLSSMSLLAQNNVDVERPSDGKALPASLFMLTLAESGERKTGCDHYFQKQIHQWEAEMEEAYKSELTDYKRLHATWKIKNSALIKQIGKAIDDPEKEAELTTRLEAHSANEPVKPRKRQLLSSDVTPEALIKRLHDGYPVGGLFNNEGGVILSARTMRNLPLLNSLWDGQPVKCERKSEPDIVLKDARLSIGLMVQPETFQKFLDNAGAHARDNGFLARCLFTKVFSTQGSRIEEIQAKKPIPHFLIIFEHNQRAYLNSQFSKNYIKPKNRIRLRLSRDAIGMWYDNFNNIERKIGRGEDYNDIKDAASKAMDNALRIAAIFHYWDGSGEEINRETFISALHLSYWHLNQFKRIFGEKFTLCPEVQDVADIESWLLNRLRSRGECIILESSIKQYGPNQLRKGNRINCALHYLEMHGKIKRIVKQRRSYVLINMQ